MKKINKKRRKWVAAILLLNSLLPGIGLGGGAVHAANADPVSVAREGIWPGGPDAPNVPTSPYFEDEDEQRGTLSGQLSWESPVYPSERPVDYHVYFASEQNRKIGDVLAKPEGMGGISQLTLDHRAIPSGAVKFAIYPVAADGTELPSPAFYRFWDAPDQVLQNVTFTDTDLDRGSIGGIVSWTPPRDQSKIASYKVYLTYGEMDPVGEPRADQMPIGEVPKGRNTWTMPPTALNFMVYNLTVVPQDIDGNLSRPASVMTTILDRTHMVAAPRESLDMEIPEQIKWIDRDARAGWIGGRLAWQGYSCPAEHCYESANSYALFFIDAKGNRLKKIGEVRRLDADTVIPPQPIPEGAKQLALFAENEMGESRQGVTASLWDYPAQFPSRLSFTDTDPLPGKISGKLTWRSASQDASVVAYSVDAWTRDEQPVHLTTIQKGEANALTLAKGTDYDPSIVRLTVAPMDAAGDAGPAQMEVPLSDNVSARTTAPSDRAITVANRAYQNDTISVTGLKSGDVLRVYASTEAEEPFGEAVVARGRSAATVTLPQLGIEAGTVYVTTTSSGKIESLRVPKKFLTETTPAPEKSRIAIANNPAHQKDSVTVNGLRTGDVVKVYANNHGQAGAWLGTSQPVEEGETKATILFDQLGDGRADALFVSATGTEGRLESSKVGVNYGVEASVAPSSEQIVVDNQIGGSNDIVTVTGLAAGDQVLLYGGSASRQTLIANVTVPKGQTFVAVKSNRLLSATGGTLYVAIKKKDRLESARVSKSYSAEPQR
jgi:hypothetical protein